jgi:hypothetical protein
LFVLSLVKNPRIRKVTIVVSSGGFVNVRQTFRW